MITVQPVLTEKQRKQFIQFPKTMVGQDPNWVAPLDMDMKKFLNVGKHPFHSYGTITPFLAYRNNVVVGRIAAVTNKLYAEHHDAETGFWGFFECINDQAVANILFDTVISTIQSKGYSKIHGPASPSCNYDFGMLTEGYETSPKIMMTHNPPYYNDLVKNYGFSVAKNLFAYKLSQETVLSNPKLARVAEIAQKRTGTTIRKINMKKLKEEVVIIKELYDKGWEKNWGHVPMTSEEIDEMAKSLGPLANKEVIIFIEKDGKPIGFALCLPDYYHILKDLKGRLFPFGFLKLLTRKKEINWVRILLLGIIPEYRGRGLDAALYLEIIRNGKAEGFDFGEASWILEDNDMMNRGLETLSGEIYKRYAIYEKSI